VYGYTVRQRGKRCGECDHMLDDAGGNICVSLAVGGDIGARDPTSGELASNFNETSMVGRCRLTL